jgi:hypothetical protein
MHWKHWHHSHQNFLWEQASKPAVPSVSVKQTRRSNTKSLITRTETNCSINHALCAFIPYTQRFNISTIVGYGSIQVANTSSHQRITPSANIYLNSQNHNAKHSSILKSQKHTAKHGTISIMCDSAWSSWTQASDNTVSIHSCQSLLDSVQQSHLP